MMTELLTMLEDAEVLCYRTDSDGDFHVTQFEESEEFDQLLATADEVDGDECRTYYRFGSVWMAVDTDMGEDE